LNDDTSIIDPDKTILQPRVKKPKTQKPRVTNSNSSIELIRDTDIFRTGVNPLEKAASKLLTILITIKSASVHPAPGQLRNQISNEIKQFQENAKTVVGDPTELQRASYVMCTALDEAAYCTPWGYNSDWAQNNLLSTFHGDVSGGEKFFRLLKKLGTSPAENSNLLELMYIILSLGYEGRYKLADDGQATLIKVREWLFNLLRGAGRAEPTVLAKNWKGSGVSESTIQSITPLWLMLTAAAALCAVVLFTVQIKLAENARETIGSFINIKAQPLSAITPPPPPAPDPVSRPTMTALLQGEIDAGNLNVIESGDSALVRLFGDSLFGSGKATVNTSAIPTIQQVSTALNKYNGSVLISGHTDNIPIRRPEFPSNLELSEARALSVHELMEQTVNNPERLEVEGLGDLQPLNDNSSKELRSKNRRVELTVQY